MLAWRCHPHTKSCSIWLKDKDPGSTGDRFFGITVSFRSRSLLVGGCGELLGYIKQILQVLCLRRVVLQRFSLLVERLVHVVPVRDEGGRTRHLVLHRNRYGHQKWGGGQHLQSSPSLPVSPVSPPVGCCGCAHQFVWFVYLLGARYGDCSGTTGIQFFGHTFLIGPVSGRSNHWCQMAEFRAAGPKNGPVKFLAS